MEPVLSKARALQMASRTAKGLQLESQMALASLWEMEPRLAKALAQQVSKLDWSEAKA